MDRTLESLDHVGMEIGMDTHDIALGAVPLSPIIEIGPNPFTQPLNFSPESLDSSHELLNSTQKYLITTTTHESLQEPSLNQTVSGFGEKDETPEISVVLGIQCYGEHEAEVGRWRHKPNHDVIHDVDSLLNNCIVDENMAVDNPSNNVDNPSNNEGLENRTITSVMVKPIHTEEKPWPCSECDQYFNKMTQLYKHMRNEHGKLEYRFCQACDGVFNNEEDWQKHQRCHSQNLVVPNDHKYRCHICILVFEKRYLLLKHNKEQHPRMEAHQCEVCLMKFSNKKQLKVHRRIHLGENACDICGKTFTDVTSIAFHKRSHTEHKPFACGLCDKRFFKRSHLNRHEKIHSRNVKFACEECEQEFQSLNALHSHEMLAHSHEKANKCDVCGKFFMNERKLLAHVDEAHAGSEGRVSCKVCGKVYAENIIKVHERTHSEVYTCDVCGIVCESAAGLTNHSKIHTGEKPNSEDEDELSDHEEVASTSQNMAKTSFSITEKLKKKRTDQKSGLFDKVRYEENLQKVKPTSERPYVCDLCGEKLTSAYGAKEHKRQHEHGVPKCDVCSKTFASYQYLKKHKLEHMDLKFGCEFCDLAFPTQLCLAHHIKFHTSLTCEVCGKSFKHMKSLRSHLKTHTNEKPFSCDICGKEFKWRSNMKLHKMNHSVEEPIECKFCGRIFTRLDTFQRHEKTHTEVDKFVCEICGRGFMVASKLKTHKELVHEHRKSFSCNLCNKSFSAFRTLEAHERLHKGEKPFVCGICGRGFAMQTRLNFHRKLKHGEPQSELGDVEVETALGIQDGL